MHQVEKLYILETSIARNKKLKDDQKIALAKQLEKLKVDLVLIDPDDTAIASKLESILKETIVVAETLPKKDRMDKALKTLKGFHKKRLRIIFTPEILDEFNLNDNNVKNDTLNMVKDAIEYAKQYVDDIEFMMIKCDKIHNMFMYRIIEAAQTAKAFVITLSDKDGKLLTHEYGTLFEEVLYNIPESESITLGCSAKNSLGLATANTLAAIINGARQVDVNLINTSSLTDNASLRAILKVYNMRTDTFKQKTNLNQEEIEPSYKMLEEFIYLK
jgi:2-isopropylmalate synthase